jgi:heme exporter protein A
MFEAKAITYERGGRNLFSQLSFIVEAGQGLQVKGENGAGKSSLLKLLAGNARANSGDVFWNKQSLADNAHNFHADLLFIGHKSGVNHHLSAEENLKWYASLSGKSLNENECDEIFKQFGLYGFEDIAAGNLSAGQQRRIALCRLLLEKKKLWLLDEPLVSLDQQGVLLFEDLLKAHLEQGGIAVFTSHQDMKLTDAQIKRLDLKKFKYAENKSAT